MGNCLDWCGSMSNMPELLLKPASALRRCSRQSARRPHCGRPNLPEFFKYLTLVLEADTICYLTSSTEQYDFAAIRKASER